MTALKELEEKIDAELNRRIQAAWEKYPRAPSAQVGNVRYKIRPGPFRITLFHASTVLPMEFQAVDFLEEKISILEQWDIIEYAIEKEYENLITRIEKVLKKAENNSPLAGS